MGGQTLALWAREPGAGDVAGRTLRSGISPVTQTLVFRGHTPENQYDAPRGAFREVVPAPDDAEALCTKLGDADLQRLHTAEQRHVTRSGWSAPPDQISRFIAEAA